MGKQKQDLGVGKGSKHLVQNWIWCSPLWDSSSASGIPPSQWYSSLHQVVHCFEPNCSNNSSYTGSLKDLTFIEESNRWMIARKMFKWKCFYWPRRQSIWGMGCSEPNNQHVQIKLRKACFIQIFFLTQLFCLRISVPSRFFPQCIQTKSVFQIYEHLALQHYPCLFSSP